MRLSRRLDAVDATLEANVSVKTDAGTAPRDHRQEEEQARPDDANERRRGDGVRDAREVEAAQPAVEQAGNEASRVVRPAVHLAAVAAAPVLRVLLRQAEEGLAVVAGRLLGVHFCVTRRVVGAFPHL